MDSPWPVFSLLLFFRCLNISLPEPWGLGPWRANDSTILANPIIFFLFFFIQQEAKIFLIETVQISNPAAVTLLKHQKRSSFQMVNSILAFTISLLLFLRAGTFAVNTFACDMTTSTPFTSTSATSVSTTSFSSHSSCTVGVWVFSGMVETASSWTFHSQQLLTVLAEIKPQSWLKKKKKNVGFWCWQLPVWIEIK